MPLQPIIMTHMPQYHRQDIWTLHHIKKGLQKTDKRIEKT